MPFLVEDNESALSKANGPVLVVADNEEWARAVRIPFDPTAPNNWDGPPANVRAGLDEFGTERLLYSFVDGTRPFTGTVGGVTPVVDSDLATRGYVRDLVIPVDYVPNSLTVTPPTSLNVGDVNSLATLDDGDAIEVEEISGSPGFDIEIGYVSVTETPTRLDLHVHYTGTSGDTVNVQIQRASDSVWVTLGTITEGIGFLYETYDIINGALYVKGDNSVDVRIRQSSQGNPTHDIFVDYAIIRKVPIGGGGGITDHGNLTDLDADDHNVGANAYHTDVRGDVRYVLKSTFNANTMLYATVDDTPATLGVLNQTLVGRLDGNITSFSINDLVAQGSPTGGADYVMTWDVGDSKHRKVLLDNLPGAGPTSVTAAAALADHRILRGDGGGRGAQDSTAIIADNGAMYVPGIGDGGVTNYDLLVGDVTTPSYGMIRIGNARLGRTSYNVGDINLAGTFLFGNLGGPTTGNIEFAFVESTGDSCRFAIPKSGAGLATYHPRSCLMIGPAPANTSFVELSYWQGLGWFHNLLCDTAGSGADFGVQNDVEIEGKLWIDDIQESTPGADITINNAKFVKTASAVNEVTITDATTTNPVSIAATGTDTSVGLNIADKGPGFGIKFFADTNTELLRLSKPSVLFATLQVEVNPGNNADVNFIVNTSTSGFLTINSGDQRLSLGASDGPNALLRLAGLTDADAILSGKWASATQSGALLNFVNNSDVAQFVVDKDGNIDTVGTIVGHIIGTNVQAWDADLDALAALAATAGMLSRTGAGAFAVRTLTGTANQITITNGTGAADNPTLSITTNPTLPGNVTVTGTGLFKGALTIGDGTAEDWALIFDGTTFDGIITWRGAQNYFQLSDHVLMATSSKINFRTTSNYIHSSVAATIDIVAPTTAISADLTVAADLTVDTDTFHVDATNSRVGIGTTAPETQLHVMQETTPSSVRGITVGWHQADTVAPAISFKKSRGSFASPAACGSTDQIGLFRGYGYDGAAYLTPVAFGFVVDGAVSSGVLPTAFRIFTGTASFGTERMRITSAGEMLLNTTTRDASALFKMVSTTQGFLLPAMTTAQKAAISSPATGLQVFDTDLIRPDYHTGLAWVPVGTPAIIQYSYDGDQSVDTWMRFGAVQTSSTTGMYMARAGSIVAHSTSVTISVVTSGDVTFEVRINDANQASLENEFTTGEGTGVKGKAATAVRDVVTFLAGDLVTIVANEAGDMVWTAVMGYLEVVFDT